MTKIFIGGSRRISRLSEQVRERIDNMIAKNFPILIGDANGADKAVQIYLDSMDYQNVQLFCSEGKCRNNIGSWLVRNIPADTRDRSAEFYSAKDRAMAQDADIGFMIWDGRSPGTLLNAVRLVNLNKKVVVYIAPDGEFREFRRRDEWQTFFANCDVALRHKVEQRFAHENGTRKSALQETFL